MLLQPSPMHQGSKNEVETPPHKNIQSTLVATTKLVGSCFYIEAGDDGKPRSMTMPVSKYPGLDGERMTH